MNNKKIVVNYNNINEYTGNKIDLDIDKINKIILKLEEKLGEQKVLLLRLNNLKRINNLKFY